MPIADKLTEEEASRRNAAVCLMCTKPECTGAAACYQQRKKNQQRIYQADRRSAERALNAFYNAMWEQERREQLKAAHRAFHEQRAKKEHIRCRVSPLGKPSSVCWAVFSCPN